MLIWVDVVAGVDMLMEVEEEVDVLVKVSITVVFHGRWPSLPRAW